MVASQFHLVSLLPQKLNHVSKKWAQHLHISEKSCTFALKLILNITKL